MNWSAWLYGLVSVVLSSAGGAIAIVIVDPVTFNLNTGFMPLLKVMGVFGIIAFGNYLKNTPAPKPAGPTGP
jgi:hypothetical protein